METVKSTTRRRAAQSSAVPGTLEVGKLPPQATDLEDAVLGAIMLEKEALTDVIDILSPEAFYKDEHQQIFSAIQQLFNDSKPIDILTVAEQLKKNGELDFVGGPYYVSQLTNRVASAANVEYHARIIMQKHIQRELIRTSTETIKDAYDDTTDIFELMDKAEMNLFSITEGNIRKNYSRMRELIKQNIDKIEELSKLKEGISGVPTGFSKLDRITSGFQKSDLIIVAARPGMGKTAFVLALARNAAVDFNRPVAFFSLEMSNVQLVNRLISSETELPSEKLRRGELADHEWQQLHSKIVNLADAPIYIDDTAALSIFELRAKCRRLKAQHNVELIIVDYLQLMTTAGDNRGNREQEISTISRSLKGIAKELDVPIIALSQLNRLVETRGGEKRPQLSDLRESGAIEQDADVVGFIYRPEYYGFGQDEAGNPTTGQGEIIIAKHRNGALGTVQVRFIEHLAKFVDDEEEFENKELVDYTESESGGTITIPSKMDDIEDNPEGAPF